MPEQDSRLYDLLARYSANACSREELAELSRLVNEANDAAMHEELDALFAQMQPVNSVEGFDLDEMFKAVVKVQPAIKRNLFYKIRYAAAAAVLLAALGTWFFTRPAKEITGTYTSHFNNDVAPGKYGAILRLADSSTIVLDSAGKGQIARQGTVGIIKTDSSQLFYRPASPNPSSRGAKEMAYNILTTPKGRQFQVQLEDGTKVWLNAGSSLTYPTAFAGDTREVMLTGEAYFEVAKDPRRPFHVKAANTDVMVLGTHFNIMAYGDEPNTETTLLEGLVQVAKAGEIKVITPGQQAVSNGNAILVKEADTDRVMAWKEGFFQFDQTSLAAILRQLSRWYDVEVSYDGAVPDRKFFGRINRHMNLSGVLQILEANNIHFRIEGNKLIVTP